MPLLPRSLKGKLRATVEAAPFARLPRPDVIWTSAREEIAPWNLLNRGPMRRPVILDLDATDAQLEAMAKHYWTREAKTGYRAGYARAQEQSVRRGITLFTPWSNWAAQGLLAEGVERSRIRVLPPGVDIPPETRRRTATEERPLRLLFVGGDFLRKGGYLLLEAAAAIGSQCEFTIVTHSAPASLPSNVRTLQAGANSPVLNHAYAQSDLFVLPTLADCFGIATIEAMSHGLPVIMTNIGGASDMVEDGRTGWLIEPNVQALLAAMRHAMELRQQLPEIGGRGRIRAIEHFNGPRNDRRVVDLAIEVAKRR